MATTSVDSLLEGLTPEQRAVVLHDRGPLLVVAGPGAGKTEVILRRAAYLVLARHVPPERILLTTFTRKAAEELRLRLAPWLGPTVERLLITTIHGFCQWVLERFPQAHQYGPAPQILDEAAQHLFVFTNLRELGLDRPRGRLGDFLAETIAAFNAYSENLVDPDRLCEVVAPTTDDPEAPIVAEAYRRYRQLLAEARLLDFPGLQREAYALLRHDSTVRQAVQAQFHYVIVDEHQDTNPLQDLILSLVAAPEHNICVVGDDDQSIYRFRGATVANFLRFPDLYPQARRIELVRNFRSTRPIVEVASRLIAHNPLRYAKALLPVRGDGPEVLLLTADDVDDEAERLVELIQLLRSSGAVERWSDIAVLFRSVRHYAQPLLEALAQRGIPAVATGNGAFFDRPDIQQLRDLLLALAWPNYWRPAHFAGPLLGLQPETLARLATLDGIIWDLPPERLAELGITPERDRSVLARLLALHDDVRQRRHGSIVNLVFRLLEASGYVAACIERGDERALRNLAQFTQLAAAFDQQDRSASPYRFGEYLRGLPERSLDELAPDDEDAVQIMTIHQAKGREFPVVIVASLVEGRLPARERPARFQLSPEQLALLAPPELTERHHHEPDASTADQRRLAYVALTRARDLLVLSAPSRIRRQRCRPSRFLSEMGLDERASELPATVPALPSRGRHGRAPLSLSTSALTTYATCPLRYFLLYDLDFQLPVWPSVHLGNAVHLALAQLHRCVLAGQVIDAQLAARSFDAYWRPPRRLTPEIERLYRTARDAVIRYVERWSHTFSSIRQAEQAFMLPIQNGVIVGRIDLVRSLPDEEGEGLELVDFKTRTQQGRELLQPELQLRLYALALEALDPRPIRRLTVHFLLDDQELSWPWDDTERARAQEALAALLDGIAARRFPPNPGRHCAACDVAALCPAAAVSGMPHAADPATPTAKQRRGSSPSD